MRLFAKLAAAALLPLVAAVVALLARPDLVVNSRTAAWALRRFGAAYSPEWRALNLSVSSRSFLDKTVALDADGFCVRGSSPPWSACFERVRARVDVLFGPGGLEEAYVRLLDVEGGPVRADLSRKYASVPKKPRSSPPEWPAWLKLGRIEIALPDNRVRLATGAVSGAIALKRPAGGSLSASARADAGPLGSALAQARAWPVPGGRAALEAKGSLASKGRTLSLDVSGIGGRSGWESGLSGRLLDPKGPVRSATLDGCRLSLGFGKKRLRVERGALGCAWSLTPKPFGPHAPKILKGRVDARGALARGRDLDSAIDATIEPAGDWYRFGGKLTAKAAGPLGGLRLSHQADLTIEIPKFERFVEYFSSSTFAVPAPLNSMRGPASLRVSGSGDGRSDPQRFELSGKTALGDGSQSLTTRVSGEVLARKLWTPERSFEASIRWDLLDVALQLPYLELQAPPRVAIDSRIKPGRMPADDEDLRMAPAPKPRPFPLALQLRVRTPDKPVRLHTNLLKDPVPLRLDVDRDKVGVSAAAARTEPFEVELFRRKALVEKFELRQSSGSNAGSVNASILYRARDSKIRILLLGSTAKPRVKFESDPPMDRSQILGLLLFGKEPSELGSDEAASVGHTNAALAEQAFGLASLFVFASTPIDYVGYNPDSQSYVVRFRLPGGATAELGSDMEETRRLRVHKRLAKNWALETELRRDSATERNAVTTFLEWFRRY